MKATAVHRADPDFSLRVVHCKRESYDVYIGRPSKWGNPFAIGADGDRAQVIERYDAYLFSSGLIEDIGELRGKVLGCWCAPRPCHGHVLVRYADAWPAVVR